MFGWLDDGADTEKGLVTVWVVGSFQSKISLTFYWIPQYYCLYRSDQDYSQIGMSVRTGMSKV